MPSNVLPRPGRGTHHRQSPTELRRQGGGKGSAQGAGRASGEIPAPSAIHEACRDAEGGKARGADDPGLACQPLFGERPETDRRPCARKRRSPDRHRPCRTFPSGRARRTVSAWPVPEGWPAARPTGPSGPVWRNRAGLAPLRDAGWRDSHGAPAIPTRRNRRPPARAPWHSDCAVGHPRRGGRPRRCRGRSPVRRPQRGHAGHRAGRWRFTGASCRPQPCERSSAALFASRKSRTDCPGWPVRAFRSALATSR